MIYSYDSKRLFMLVCSSIFLVFYWVWYIDSNFSNSKLIHGVQTQNFIFFLASFTYFSLLNTILLLCV